MFLEQHDDGHELGEAVYRQKCKAGGNEIAEQDISQGIIARSNSTSAPLPNSHRSGPSTS